MGCGISKMGCNCSKLCGPCCRSRKSKTPRGTVRPEGSKDEASPAKPQMVTTEVHYYSPGGNPTTTKTAAGTETVTTTNTVVTSLPNSVENEEEDEKAKLPVKSSSQLHITGKKAGIPEQPSANAKSVEKLADEILVQDDNPEEPLDPVAVEDKDEREAPAEGEPDEAAEVEDDEDDEEGDEDADGDDDGEDGEDDDEDDGDGADGGDPSDPSGKKKRKIRKRRYRKVVRTEGDAADGQPILRKKKAVRSKVVTSSSREALADKPPTSVKGWVANAADKKKTVPAKPSTPVAKPTTPSTPKTAKKTVVSKAVAPSPSSRRSSLTKADAKKKPNGKSATDSPATKSQISRAHSIETIEI
ncbi:hypothetical protein DFS34DRAFT_187875 [Phlyctochytrium arcticum]|nr:hypothetical protein DFS34DRAFT_187875 [Phlyctochytrium arcticum]